MTKLLKLFAVAFLAMFSLSVWPAASSTTQATGTITTQNLVSAGTCTTGGCVEIGVTAESSLSVQVTGTYTAAGGLTAQATLDGSTWVNLCSSSCATTFTRATTGVASAAITSGQQDVYAISFPAGTVKVRITALGAVTGTATITLQTSTSGGGVSSSAGGGGGGAVTIADGASVALGATTDAASGADANGTVNAHLRELTKASAQLPSAMGVLATASSLSTAVSTSDAAPVTAAAATATRGIVSAGTYNTAYPVMTNTQQGGLQMTVNGAVLTAPEVALPVTGTAVAAGVLSNMPFAVGKGAGSIVVDITANTATANFEASSDGTAAYRTVTCWIWNSTGSSGAVTGTTTASKYICPVEGTHFRLSQAGAGGVTATVTPSVRAFTGIQSVYVSNSSVAVAGTIAEDSPANATSVPLPTGFEARTSNKTAMSTNGDMVRGVATMVGVPISMPYSIPDLNWVYAAATSGIAASTTAVTVKNAAAAGIRNYITGLCLQTATLGNATEFAIRDGAAGTVLWRTQLQTTALPMSCHTFNTPLRGTAATLLEIVTLTSATGGVYANLQGFEAP